MPAKLTKEYVSECPTINNLLLCDMQDAFDILYSSTSYDCMMLVEKFGPTKRTVWRALLEAACKYGDFKTVKYINDYNFRIGDTHIGYAICTALKHGNYKCADILFKNYKEPINVCIDDFTAFHIGSLRWIRENVYPRYNPPVRLIERPQHLSVYVGLCVGEIFINELVLSKNICIDFLKVIYETSNWVENPKIHKQTVKTLVSRDRVDLLDYFNTETEVTVEGRRFYITQNVLSDNNELLMSCKNLDMVKYIWDKCNVDQKIHYHDVECARFLKDKGVIPNRHDLYYSCHKVGVSIDVLEVILESNTNLDLRSNNDRILNNCIKEHNIHIGKYIIDNMERPELPQNYFCRICKNGHLEYAKYLYENYFKGIINFTTPFHLVNLWLTEVDPDLRHFLTASYVSPELYRNGDFYHVHGVFYGDDEDGEKEKKYFLDIAKFEKPRRVKSANSV